MRTVLMTVIGVALAFAFDALAAALKRRGAARALDGGMLFVWIWLGIMIADFYLGVSEGNALPFEIAVHAFLFAVPAGVGWYLSRRRRAPAEITD